MNQIFREKWLKSVEIKKSVLCAGLDPAESGMRRGDNGLPNDAVLPRTGKMNKLVWTHDYIEAVKPFVAAIKPNSKYWKGEKDRRGLREIVSHAHELGLVAIDDCKLADLNDTNEAEIYFDGEIGFDALTIAPYAGNMEGTAMLCKKYGIGAITMCLMSNPEYKREKSMLVRIPSGEERNFLEEDIVSVQGVSYVERYKVLAHNADLFELDGIVIGAPSSNNHITEEELANVRKYVSDEMLVLCPGTGAQGGEAESLWKHFDKDNVIVNVGRALMFPIGSYSPASAQMKSAKQYRDMLNEKRAA